MSTSKKIVGVVVVLACFTMGLVAFARSTVPQSTAAVLAHHTGHESRTRAQCENLPGNENVAGNPPAGNMRYWCIRCVTAGHQHYHPDCPVGSRCSPDNGVPQCGGGAF